MKQGKQYKTWPSFNTWKEYQKSIDTMFMYNNQPQNNSVYGNKH